MYIDTDREKDIGLGSDYPFEPLGPLECIIPKKYKEGYGLTVGFPLQLKLSAGNLLKSMVAEYNRVRGPGQQRALNPSSSTMLDFSCNIKGFADNSYGKYGSDNEDETFIMEYS